MSIDSPTPPQQNLAKVESISRFSGRNNFLGYRTLGAIGATGITIALSGLGVAATEALLLGRAPNALDLAVITLLVLGGYRVDYATGSATESGRFTRWRRAGGFLLAIAILMIGTTLVCAYRGMEPALGLWIFPLLVFLYAHPIGPRTWPWRCFKDIPYFKSIYTALVWGALPLYAAWLAGDSFNFLLPWLAVVTGLRMFINATACDFKDLKIDHQSGVRSIPSRLGRRRSCRLLHAANLEIVLLTATLVWIGWLPATVHWFHLAALYPFLYLIALERRWVDDGWIAAVIIDLEFALWPLYLWCLWP